MKIFKLVFSVLAVISLWACVHDDDYDIPPIGECTDLVANTSLAELKGMFNGNEVHITEDIIIEGYVVSSDEAGNIYKNLFIQNDSINPTHGLTISLDATDTYLNYPIGSKVYINCKDLWIGEYGDVVQLGDMNIGDDGSYEFGRIPVAKVDTHIFKSCADPINITPKVVSLGSLNPNLIGALVQIDNVEVTCDLICSPFASPEQTENREITNGTNSIIVRNSGYADFYNQYMPSGRGSIVAVLSKFGDTDQLYLRDENDMAGMTGERTDGSTPTCSLSEDNANIQDIKDQYTGGLTQISSDLSVEATITANDATGNLYKLIYVQDETGGLRIRLNATDLYFSPKFQVGNTITIKAKDLYIDDSNGELHLGGLYNGNIGNIEECDIHKHIFDSDTQSSEITPTTIQLSSLNMDDIGKLVQLNDVEFADSELGLSYAGSSATNRTLKDCDGNTILVRTSNYATFANETVAGGQGSLVGVFSIYNGDYQLWLRNTDDVDMNGNRCDGSTPPANIFLETFSLGLGQFTGYSVTGTQAWTTTTFGNPGPSAIMNGFSGGAQNNEDWLVSEGIELTGYTNYNLSFESDGRYSGPPIELLISTDFSGDVTTATWTALPATFDSNLNAWGPWVSSGLISLNAYNNQTVYIAYKYTSSTSGGATTWEIDNVKVAAN